MWVTVDCVSVTEEGPRPMVKHPHGNAVLRQLVARQRRLFIQETMCPVLQGEVQTPAEDANERFIRHHIHQFTCKENTRQGSRAIGRSLRNTHREDNPAFNDGSIEDERQDLSARRQISLHIHKTLRTRQLVIDFDGDQPIFKLREPLDLFTFLSTSCPFQGVRWPIECEVINDIIHHIEWNPPEPELFYKPTGDEEAPMLVGEDKGHVVYCDELATKTPYFTCSRVGGSRGTVKNVASCAIHQTTLDFESRFESGNLRKAVQVGLHAYELILHTDMYTNKHTQWFYFRVRNMNAGVTYRFTIVNLMKSNSLYSLGMRPLLYSERASKERGVGWHRIGADIRYYRNHNQDKNRDRVTLYSLSWTFQFPYDADTCYLAHCYPYTYSQLQRYLIRVTSNPSVAAYCKLRVLCRSLAGNPVPLLTITSPRSGRVEGRHKRAVVVTARVHPGETNGSWMMEGFLDFLLGDSDDAQLLRDTFVFKVVPMLNPDGVVVGNYRCSLAGRDLNRYYRTMLRDSFPCVWFTRNMVKRLMAERDVVLYCDFHGHSRKNNVFMYGCNNHDDARLQLHERVFPLMMSKNASDKFSFRSCKFRVQKSKEGTGRIVMWRLGIRNSYTLESTFGGSTLGKRRGSHFTTCDLKSLGYYFCDTLLDYCDPDPTKTTYCLTELAVMLRDEVKQRLGKELGNDCNIPVSDLESSTSGSNSTDSDGLPAHLLDQANSIHAQQTPVKKKHLRTLKDRNRLRQARVEENIEPKEPNLVSEDMVKVRIQEKTVVRNRRMQGPFGVKMNSLTQKPVIPHPATHLRDVGHVTLWQDGEPVKYECLDTMRTSYIDCRVKACPHISTSFTEQSHVAKDEPKAGKAPKFTTKLLHLSDLLPPQPNTTELFQPELRQTESSLISSGVWRGRPPASLSAAYRSLSGTLFQADPEMFQLRGLKPCMLSNLHSAKSSTHQLCMDRNTTKGSIRFFVSEGSPSISSADAIKQRKMKTQWDQTATEESEDSQTVRHPSYSQSLSKETLLEKERKEESIFPPVFRTSSLFQMELPSFQSDTLHWSKRPHVSKDNRALAENKKTK